MRTVRSLSELLAKGYNQVRLIDTQEYEVNRYRSKYPTLNIWSTCSESITDDILSNSARCNIATVVPSRSCKYSNLLDKDNVFICLELVGGL